MITNINTTNDSIISGNTNTFLYPNEPLKKELYEPYSNIIDDFESVNDTAFNYKRVLGDIIKEGEICIFVTGNQKYSKNGNGGTAKMGTRIQQKREQECSDKLTEYKPVLPCSKTKKHCNGGTTKATYHYVSRDPSVTQC
jgi:hypothetical protein